MGSFVNNPLFCLFVQLFSREVNPDFSSNITFQSSDVTFSKLQFGCNVSMFGCNVFKVKVRMLRFQSSDIMLKFGYSVSKFGCKRFQSSGITYSKFGYNVFKVRMQRFHISDITFSKFGYNVFISRITSTSPNVSHTLLSLRYGADLGRSRLVFCT